MNAAERPDGTTNAFALHNNETSDNNKTLEETMMLVVQLRNLLTENTQGRGLLDFVDQEEILMG